MSTIISGIEFDGTEPEIPTTEEKSITTVVSGFVRHFPFRPQFKDSDALNALQKYIESFSSRPTWGIKMTSKLFFSKNNFIMAIIIPDVRFLSDISLNEPENEFVEKGYGFQGSTQRSASIRFCSTIIPQHPPTFAEDVLEPARVLLPQHWRDSGKPLQLEGWELLRYTTGGHFIHHVDTKKNATHLGTLLVYPPANLSPFEGGDLVVDDVPIKPSTFTSWTVVVIPLSVFHHCTPVASGIRYVFKCRLHAHPDCELIPKVRSLPPPETRLTEIPVDNRLEEAIREEIAQLEKRLRDLPRVNNYDEMLVSLRHRIKGLLQHQTSINVGIAGYYEENDTIADLKGMEYQLAYDLLADYDVDLVERQVDIPLDKYGLRPFEHHSTKYNRNIIIAPTPGYQYGYENEIEDVYNDETYVKIDEVSTFALWVRPKAKVEP